MSHHPSSPDGLTRRELTTVMAWTAPAIVAAAAAPAAEASPAPTPGFEGLTGSWSTPVTRNGRTDVTLTVVNTGTTSYQLDSLRLDRAGGDDFGAPAHTVPTIFTNQLFWSFDNVLHAGGTGTAVPRNPYSYVLTRDGAPLTLRPGELLQFDIVAVIDRFDLVLTPGMNPEHSSVIAPCSFSSITFPGSGA